MQVFTLIRLVYQLNRFSGSSDSGNTVLWFKPISCSFVDREWSITEETNSGGVPEC